MKSILITALAAVSLSACATLEIIDEQLAASNTSIVEAAMLVREYSDVRLDLSKIEGRLVLYGVVDIVGDMRRGVISEEEGRRRIRALVLGA